MGHTVSNLYNRDTKRKAWTDFSLPLVLSLQSKDIGNAIWTTSLCTIAYPGNLFLWSLTGQCYTGEK